MTPLIKSGQEHVLSPINLSDVEVGDIVFCKVKGRYYTHLVKAKGDRGVLIGNNHGKINGWTKSVFGKVTKRKENRNHALPKFGKIAKPHKAADYYDYCYGFANSNPDSKGNEYRPGWNLG